MFLNAPFTDHQVKSINTYQRVDHLFSKLTCKCGGLMYADEAGIICKKCLHAYNEVPAFIANGIYNKFSKKEKE